ncbi:MAG: type II toxin-antitoxin system death-on-curing family toxin [Chloroflexota bacterium]|nr:type II toxin-antitoxin system death-on-curing family toxin [Chloroflexota bacterium]
MIFPTRGDIIGLNRYHIEHTGGLYQGIENLLNPGSLEWVLDAIQYPLFGVDLYPTLVAKAALLTWAIIGGHIFHDGNKRTGAAILQIFLRQNGYDITASDDELIEVALKVAEGSEENFTVEDLTQWIGSRLCLEPNVGFDLNLTLHTPVGFRVSAT